MHIGYIISKYPAVSHTFVQREVLGLRKLGWTVTTMSIRRTGAEQLLTETDREEEGRTAVVVTWNPLKLLAAGIYPLVTRPGKFFGGLKRAWRMRRAGVRGAVWALFYFVEALLVHRMCRRRGIEHLHAHFANVASDVAMIAAILNGGSFSFTMHGPTEFFDVCHHRLAEKTRAARFVACISDFARSQLMSMVPDEHWGKLRVVHCGVDPQQFHQPRKEKRMGEGRTEILCVARLVPVKGHAVLLQAIAELGLRGHEVVATFAGDGPLREELEKAAEVLGLRERVRFLGNVGQDVIHRLYAEADVFVLPSFAEGVPVVLMEAMAARCPVVATRIAGIPELIEHGVTGWLANPGRADCLAECVERVLLNPRNTERMALAGQERIRREFNLESIAPQLAGIFRKTLDVTEPVIEARKRGAREMILKEGDSRPGEPARRRDPERVRS